MDRCQLIVTSGLRKRSEADAAVRRNDGLSTFTMFAYWSKEQIIVFLSILQRTCRKRNARRASFERFKKEIEN